jgi:hypothetical protein
MAAEADPRGFAELISIGASTVLGVIAWLFSRAIKQHDTQLAEIKTKADAALPRAEWDQARSTWREDIKELYGRDERMREHVDAKAEAVMKRLDDLRDDLNAGMNGLRDEIRRK